MEGNVRRRVIDSGISGISVGDEDKLSHRSTSETSEDDIVFKDKAENSKNPQNSDGSKEQSVRSGPVIAIKERMLPTANLIKFGAKYFAVSILIWLIGFLGFSFLWILIGVIIFTWRERRRQQKEIVSEVLENIAADERKYFQTVRHIYKMSEKDLPSWVYFPDVEKAEWLNNIMVQLWPYVGDFVKNVIIETVEPSICESNQLLKGFSFSRVDLGEKSPRVAGIKVYGTGQTRRTEIVMDLQLIYDSDCNIRVTVNKLNAGIKNLTLRGVLRVELRPLVSTIPLVGAVSVAFVHKPSIDFDLTDLGNFLDLPVVDSVLRSSICDVVSSMMVLPEKYIVKLCDDIDISRLLHPLPQGVVRVHIIEAKNLLEKDKKILNIGGGSDPFVEVKVGRDHEFRTNIIKHDVNPKWNESFDAIVSESHTSMIEITLYDDDGALSKADYLGSAAIQMKSVYKQGVIDEWIPLSNVKHGSIHVKIEWLELSDDLAHITEAMEHAGRHNLNSALVSIYIDSAKDLPAGYDSFWGFDEGKYEPSPFVKVIVPGNKALKTKAIPNTNNPAWEENFRSLMQNPRMDSLQFTVQDSRSKEEALGVLKVRVSQLLNSPDMTREEPFQLSGSGPNSELQMRLTVRLLKPKGLVMDGCGSSSFVIAKGNEKPVENAPAVKENTEVEDEPSPAVPEVEVVEAVSEPSITSDESVESGFPSNFGNTHTTHNESSSELHRSASIGSEVSHIMAERNLKNRVDKKIFNNNREDDSKFPLGRLNLTLSYSQDREKLYADVHKAENLVVCDEDNSTSDPYVRIYLVRNGKSGVRRKTKVIKNNLNPVFGERLEFGLYKEEVPNHQLDIAVKNKTGLLSSEKVLMGKVFIDLAEVDLDAPVNAWYVLQVRPGDET